APYDRSHADRFRMTGHSRSQAAEAANYEIDRQALLRSSYQLLADLLILELIHFCHNARGLARFVVFHLASNQPDKTVPHIPRRYQEPFELGRPSASG